MPPIYGHQFISGNMAFSVDLAKEALKELRFLAVVNKNKQLLDEGNLLKWAIYRYGCIILLRGSA